jgi:predicted  nucleic acid-binding Zn-ribbon protein
MSYEQRIVVDESSSNKNVVVANQRRDARFGSTVHYTSSIVINLQKLQNELQTQHQHEKNSLNDLNQRLHAFVGRVQTLQSENARYLAAIADLRRRQSGVAYDVKTEEHFFTSRSNLLAIRSAVIDCEWDTELLCMQIAIYKELIGIEENWDKKRVLILEDELKQSSSALAGIRSSYAELQRTIENLHLQCGDLRKQYFALTHDWCNCKKQRRKWDYTMETLKSFISFYKNLHSYSER